MARRNLKHPGKREADRFAVGRPELIDQAAEAAERAFWSYGYSSRTMRAGFLRRIADEIDLRGDQITAMGCSEAGLPEARLIGVRGRTTGQLRLFAHHLETGAYLDRRHDPAPMPGLDLRMMQRPIGPVPVFGASNFPLVFSTAGGDTAAALAAGCPVMVKGYSAHPGTSDIVAQAIVAAITAFNIHPGVFSHTQGGNRVIGTTLVQHPLIQAVGFTGSLFWGQCVVRPLRHAA